MFFSQTLLGDTPYNYLDTVYKAINVAPALNYFPSCSTGFIVKVDDKFTYFLTCAHGFQKSNPMQQTVPIMVGFRPYLIRQCIKHRSGEFHGVNDHNDYIIFKAPKMAQDRAVKIKVDTFRGINDNLIIIGCENGGRPKLYLVKCIMVDETHIFFEPALDPGISGGPIFNMEGEVVGIIQALIASPDENASNEIGAAIRITKIPVEEPA